MGASKTDHFTKEQNELAAIAKALGHPARIAIIQHLLKVNTCVCSAIVDELPLAQPTVSQHLKELKQTGLIQGSVEGNSICYCINGAVWEKYQKIFANLFEGFKNNIKCC